MSLIQFVQSINLAVEWESNKNMTSWVCDLSVPLKILMYSILLYVLLSWKCQIPNKISTYQNNINF